VSSAGKTSTTLTSDPSASYTEAISSPMMPPPITSRRPTPSSISSASVEPITRGSSSGIPGIEVAREPTATMAQSKETLRTPCAVSTSTRLAETKRPLPVTNSTLRCAASLARPPVSLATTLSLYARSPAKSTRGGSKVTPRSAREAASEITPATCSSVLEGMQPTFRHTPPSRAWRSTSTTRLPRSAARNAAV
jgi:hypothetical protein